MKLFTVILTLWGCGIISTATETPVQEQNQPPPEKTQKRGIYIQSLEDLKKVLFLAKNLQIEYIYTYSRNYKEMKIRPVEVKIRPVSDDRFQMIKAILMKDAYAVVPQGSGQYRGERGRIMEDGKMIEYRVMADLQFMDGQGNIIGHLGWNNITSNSEVKRGDNFHSSIALHDLLYKMYGDLVVDTVQIREITKSPVSIASLDALNKVLLHSKRAELVWNNVLPSSKKEMFQRIPNDHFQEIKLLMAHACTVKPMNVDAALVRGVENAKVQFYDAQGMVIGSMNVYEISSDTKVQQGTNYLSSIALPDTCFNLYVKLLGIFKIRAAKKPVK